MKKTILNKVYANSIMENRKKRTALKILIFILLLAILYFAYSVGKYDIKRENMIESVQ